jgi:hypothetical protein
MKKAKPPRQPNYVRKLKLLQRLGVLPASVGVHEVIVLHDAWCAHLRGRACNCDPEVKLGWSQPAVSRN